MPESSHPSRPLLPIPAPLRGSDIGTFAHHSIVVRLVDIGRRTIAENQFTPAQVERFEALLAEIPNTHLRSPQDGALDCAAWEVYLAAYPGYDWLQVPWFLAENYFYRRVLEATGYFQDGPGQGRDPFAGQKRLGLESSRGSLGPLASRLEQALRQTDEDSQVSELVGLLHASLWGNQADLSLWPADGEGKPDHKNLQTAQAHLLVDDGETAAGWLASHQPARVDVLIDNAGFELVGDLALVDYLLSSRMAERVRLHVKTHPTFVSDALEGDVLATVDFLQAQPAGQALGARLQHHLDQGQLQLRWHPFWTSPLPGWEMPADLRRTLAEADLVIAKGDAHYRRTLGDRHWDYTASFQQITAYYPARLLALRTLKSEVAAGLRAEQVRRLNEIDPEWIINGKWGVLQLK